MADFKSTFLMIWHALSRGPANFQLIHVPQENCSQPNRIPTWNFLTVSYPDNIPTLSFLVLSNNSYWRQRWIFACLQAPCKRCSNNLHKTWRLVPKVLCVGAVPWKELALKQVATLPHVLIFFLSRFVQKIFSSLINNKKQSPNLVFEINKCLWTYS